MPNQEVKKECWYCTLQWPVTTMVREIPRGQHYRCKDTHRCMHHCTLMEVLEGTIKPHPETCLCTACKYFRSEETQGLTYAS